MHVCAQLRGTFRLKISRGGGLEQTLSSEYLRGNWNQPGVKHACVSVSFHHLVTFSRFSFSLSLDSRDSSPSLRVRFIPTTTLPSALLLLVSLLVERGTISSRRGIYAHTDNKSWSRGDLLSGEFPKFCDFSEFVERRGGRWSVGYCVYSERGTFWFSVAEIYTQLRVFVDFYSFLNLTHQSLEFQNFRVSGSPSSPSSRIFKFSNSQLPRNYGRFSYRQIF